MKTAIYARFSSQLQKDSSIEDQVRVCAERAAREGWQVTEVFSDYAISGAVRDRPGLNALIAHVQAGQSQLVLAEAIDRLSRDQEDLANIHKRIRFAGARIVTLSEGDVDELQIGFKGTMASLFRKDLADKIRRGQRGRVAVGRVPGNIVYGYRKLARLDARGEPERGLREIDELQADVIRRIYREYLSGESPLAIARRLNAEGVPGPSGGKWNVSAIGGDTVRGNGVLCNPIYVGELTYNRTTMVRDPDTRRRVPRANPRDQWQVEPVPHLAVVDRASWDAVRARKGAHHDWSFRSQRRPQRLLSGLLTCGECNGNMAVIGDGKWGCTAARKQGTCSNRRTIDNAALERRVLQGLEKELLSPDRVALAVKAYHDERQRLDREDRAVRATSRHRARELEKQIERLVGAITAGAGDVPEVVARLQQLRAERAQLSDALDETAAARVITLHPGIASAYRKAVEQITSLIGGDGQESREARQAIRSLLDRVVLTPRQEARGMDVEIEGRLALMLGIGIGKAPAGPEGSTLRRRREGTAQVVAEECLRLDRTLRRVRV